MGAVAGQTSVPLAAGAAHCAWHWQIDGVVKAHAGVFQNHQYECTGPASSHRSSRRRWTSTRVDCRARCVPRPRRPCSRLPSLRLAYQRGGGASRSSHARALRRGLVRNTGMEARPRTATVTLTACGPGGPRPQANRGATKPMGPAVGVDTVRSSSSTLRCRDALRLQCTGGEPPRCRAWGAEDFSALLAWLIVSRCRQGPLCICSVDITFSLRWLRLPCRATAAD